MRVVITAGRYGCGATCGIVKIAREAVSLSKLEIEHGLQFMWSVVFRWIPLAVVQRCGNSLVVLTKQRA